MWLSRGRVGYRSYAGPKSWGADSGAAKYAASESPGVEEGLRSAQSCSWYVVCVRYSISVVR